MESPGRRHSSDGVSVARAQGFRDVDRLSLPEADVEGRIERLNARWNVKVSPWIPKKLDDNPREAVMKVDVQVLWQGRSTERSVKLETIKGTVVSYNHDDFKNAIETALPN